MVKGVEPGARWVLAVDPGLVTGWAVVSLDGKTAPTFGETEGRFNFQDVVRRIAGSGVILEIVSEEYTVNEDTHKKTRQYDAFYINGWLEGESYHHGWKFTFQRPYEAKGFAKDETLKAVGWWAPSEGGHQNDAMRHLVTYLVRRHRRPGELGLSIAEKILEEDE